jgi:hypothetical protein
MTATAADSFDLGVGQSAQTSASRHERLSQAASRIRVKPGLNVPVERILLIGATILFPLGLVLVLLGWEGAAHTGYTYAQIDYLISGGLFGLGLSVAGGFMYFGYWLSRQIGDSRRQNALTLQALGRLEELLDASLNSQVIADHSANGFYGPPAATPAVAAAAASARTSTGAAPARRGTARKRAAADAPTGEVPALMLVATPRGSLLHRSECPIVAKRTDLRQIPVGSDGFGYCTMCDAAGELA